MDNPLGARLYFTWNPGFPTPNLGTMSNHQYPCPKCGTVLKPKNPLTAGKKIKCPKCATIFAPVTDDDDDGEGTYGLNRADDQAEQATEGERKKAMAPLKTRGKSSRGPAQAIVTPPSNKMLGTAVITCVGSVLTIIVMLWPIVFSGEKQIDELTKATSRKKIVVETPEQKRERIITNLIWLGVAVLAFVYNGAIATAAVKMQSLESYSWAMAGSFMVMLPFNWGLSLAAFKWFTALVTSIAGDEIGGMLTLATLVGVNLFYVYVGVWNVKTLRDETVVAGFQEEAPKDM